jgi:hypothetical protein
VILEDGMEPGAEPPPVATFVRPDSDSEGDPDTRDNIPVFPPPRSASGPVRVTYRRLAYDHEKTIQKIYAIPELEPFLGDRLRQGR